MLENQSQVSESFFLKEEFAKRKETIFKLGIGEVAKLLGINSVLFLVFMNPNLGQDWSDRKGLTKAYWEQKFSIIDRVARTQRSA